MPYHLDEEANWGLNVDRLRQALQEARAKVRETPSDRYTAVPLDARMCNVLIFSPCITLSYVIHARVATDPLVPKP